MTEIIGECGEKLFVLLSRVGELFWLFLFWEDLLTEKTIFFFEARGVL